MFENCSVLLAPYSDGTLDSTLAIDHLACQESALHGLGHRYHRQQQDVVEGMIDELLGRGQNLRVAL